MKPHEMLASALGGGRTAVIPYLTGGFPDMGAFLGHLDSLSRVAPALEIGVPFSDPMADGATIQESSRSALASGATLDGVIGAIEKRASGDTPLVMMSYLNPLLAYGVDDLLPRLAAAGVCGLVVPDLPLEESGVLDGAARTAGIGLIQMVTPLTSPDRRDVLARGSQGFVYAVTMTGTTGQALAGERAVAAYLDDVRSVADVPVVAGFGVRSRIQVERLDGHCDGVIVGSAIVERIMAGGDPVDLVEELRGAR